MDQEGAYEMGIAQGGRGNKPYLAFGLILSLCLTGCGGGGGKLPVAKVVGKVVSDGKPVTGGSITFAPVGNGKDPAGKPASGAVQTDGTFKLFTYRDNDGAVIGKHKVTYSAPAGEAKEGPDGHSVQTPSPYAGLAVQNPDVEIKSSGNEITIELKK